MTLTRVALAFRAIGREVEGAENMAPTRSPGTARADLDAAGPVAADPRLRGVLGTILARCEGIEAAVDADCVARSPDGNRGALHAQAEHQTQN